jgi:hypothetical protein
MKPAGSIALAMGVGYLLGGAHKLRTALLLGTAVATGRLSKRAHAAAAAAGDGSGDGHGMLGKLGGAGSAAARAALTKPIERLGNRLSESAEAMRQAGQASRPADGGSTPHDGQRAADNDGGDGR